MDFNEIAEKFSSAKLLGVGESSHGTHEFFEFKTILFKELVMNHGFNTLFFEDQPKTCDAINEFIASGTGNVDKLTGQLYPIWRTEELKQLFLWLRKINPKHGVKFVGFDIEQTDENMPKRDELMAKNIKKYVDAHPKTKGLVWAHNSHLQKVGSNFNPKPTGLFLRKYFGDDYAAVALLFGVGTLSATKLKEDVPPGRDRRLSAIKVDTIPPNITEFSLHKLKGDSEPFFLSKESPEFAELNNTNFVRSIGWGVIPELINEVIEKTNIKKSFDGIMYFPKASHSQSLSE
ncbi:MAG: erythromycin esterase family protein [Candidatus Saccharibacteria bacterium]|nr:erythromycin esterase family protein [Candidatus Saccharibacteria bacterium]